ncbi:DNA recombination-mediator protein A [Novosphingobium sp. PhB55]|nr:DNA recombination-mediator protein A [Novosphingobium sp. PhB55]
MHSLSSNAKAILLLTGPLLAKGGGEREKVLSLGEYNKLAKRLGELEREPADLLLPSSDTLLKDCASVIETARLYGLLNRGFLLGQVVERWQAQAIWVVSRADPTYPRRLKDRLKKDAPPILYGCGNGALLEAGGLAVVGSRDADRDQALMDYTTAAGALCADAGVPIVSGGARGVDQTAMDAALNAGGRSIGILSGDLERGVLKRANRDPLINGQLVLCSPFDPSARFQPWAAMARNKLIYALSDAALVIDADPVRGGTRDGALEQLNKLRLVPVYVRVNGSPSAGLDALRNKGARDWPEPRNPDELQRVFDASATPEAPSPELPLLQMAEDPQPVAPSAADEDKPQSDPVAPPTSNPVIVQQSPADLLFTTVRMIILPLLTNVKKDAEIAQELGVEKAQAKAWLVRLMGDGEIVKSSRPAGYVAVADHPSLI